MNLLSYVEYPCHFGSAIVGDMRLLPCEEDDDKIGSPWEGTLSLHVLGLLIAYV